MRKDTLIQISIYVYFLYKLFRDYHKSHLTSFLVYIYEQEVILRKRNIFLVERVFLFRFEYWVCIIPNTRVYI